MSKMFFVGMNQEAVAMKVVISKDCNSIYLMRDDRIVAVLSATDVFTIKDELDTERGYMGLTRVYLMRLIDTLGPDFESAINNEAYVVAVTEKFAERLRLISPLDLSEEMRQSYFDEAFSQVDYRRYVLKTETRVGA